MRFKFILLSIIVAVCVIACASPPNAEMESAREAVFRAENDADAVIYGSASLARARDALRRMQEEADAKRYDTAKTLAAEAITAAEKAIADGRAGAARASSESGNLVEGLRSEIEDTTRNVNGARYSQLDLDYNALDNGIRNAHDMTDRAENSYANGEHQAALDTARVVRSNLADINQQVVNAVPRRK
ncbi:MAG: DUF4398 domain-containing protein [Treponema sp.]|jgi:hypothetical protein|nr:DUF4398 domain-containing protein [Treponema sp.]